MAQLCYLKIRHLIDSGKRFSGISDNYCKGLYLCWPEKYRQPFWRFRYKIDGISRSMTLGPYGPTGLSLVDARKIGKDLKAEIRLGGDPLLEKRLRKAKNKAKSNGLNTRTKPNTKKAKIPRKFKLWETRAKPQEAKDSQEQASKPCRPQSPSKLKLRIVTPENLDLFEGEHA